MLQHRAPPASLGVLGATLAWERRHHFAVMSHDSAPFGFSFKPSLSAGPALLCLPISLEGHGEFAALKLAPAHGLVRVFPQPVMSQSPEPPFVPLLERNRPWSDDSCALSIETSSAGRVPIPWLHLHTVPRDDLEAEMAACVFYLGLLSVRDPGRISGQVWAL